MRGRHVNGARRARRRAPYPWRPARHRRTSHIFTQGLASRRRRPRSPTTCSTSTQGPRHGFSDGRTETSMRAPIASSPAQSPRLQTRRSPDFGAVVRTLNGSQASAHRGPGAGAHVQNPQHATRRRYRPRPSRATPAGAVASSAPAATEGRMAAVARIGVGDRRRGRTCRDDSGACSDNAARDSAV